MPESIFWDSCEEIEAVLDQYVHDEVALPVRTKLRYRSADPFAVTLDFQNASGLITSWRFSRDLLYHGMNHDAGNGDVRIWPADKGEEPLLCILLRSSGSHALFTTESDPIRAWLDRSFDLIPRGTESALIDWESVIDSLMLP
ncbi:SsgA family sporulation/cell division regulator [Streptomyces sp. NPDC015127]|uniref:SsgA family sporulation/cell division regulator n=1 Tax=Streptomyces sp. NPDC015127 TaxID=3364939 RepID=UPI0036FB320A